MSSNRKILIAIAAFITILGAIHLCLPLVSSHVVDGMEDATIEKIDNAVGPYFSKSWLKFRQPDNKNFIKVETSIRNLTHGLPKIKNLARKPEVYLICDKTFNAFAAPGNTLVILSGLLQKVDSYDELIFVIGHEAGHLQLRHPYKRAFASLLQTLFMMFFSLGGEFQSSLSNQVLLAHSRESELEADRYSLNIIQSKYGRVDGAMLFFNRLKTPLEAVINFSSTHPISDERIAQTHQHAFKIDKKVRPLPGSLKNVKAYCGELGSKANFF